MKKLLFLFLAAILPAMAGAEPVAINGIYYNLIPKGNFAEVSKNPFKYSGEIIIPETVMYEGKEYNVASIENYAFSECND